MKVMNMGYSGNADAWSDDSVAPFASGTMGSGLAVRAVGLDRMTYVGYPAYRERTSGFFDRLIDNGKHARWISGQTGGSARHMILHGQLANRDNMFMACDIDLTAYPSPKDPEDKDHAIEVMQMAP
jgi:hypothetical protein